MSFADDSPPSASLRVAASISSFVRPSKSTYVSNWDNETVVPPPEHNAMRLRAEMSTKQDLDGVVNHHSNNEVPGDTDFPQPDQTDSQDEGRLTMEKLGLQKVVTAPETITIYEACCLMSAGGADAVVLTDSNALLSGILTNKDILSRVIASGIDLVNTPASKVMTKNPIFVSSDTHPMEAIRKMVQGEVTQVPIIENGEVIGIVGLAKCFFDIVLYSAISESAEEEELVISAIPKLARWNYDINTGSSEEEDGEP